MDGNQRAADVRGFTRLALPEPTTRRHIVTRLGTLAVSGAALLAADADPVRAKKKRKKKRDPSLKLADWLGTWFTRLSNGVQGTATFRLEFGQIVGNYSNSEGSGVFRCYEDPGGKKTDLGCRYDQTEGEPQAGSFQIDLTTKNHWEGEYQIDGGGGGTWSGDRR